MGRRDALILRAAAIWIVFVWVNRVINLASSDEDAGFVTIHLLLALVSIIFAVAIWRVASRNRREVKEHSHYE
ncbi:MAG TPA: hypothetical protein VM121_01855 [Acidimicrobiales bacterium]|nr:hypothetical protein [Acidimicrobiales bacterium]